MIFISLFKVAVSFIYTSHVSVAVISITITGLALIHRLGLGLKYVLADKIYKVVIVILWVK